MTVSTTHSPASDLGFLPHKHPDRPQRFEVAAGVAHVRYPASGPRRCTPALLLGADPVELVRSARGRSWPCRRSRWRSTCRGGAGLARRLFEPLG